MTRVYFRDCWALDANSAPGAPLSRLRERVGVRANCIAKAAPLTRFSLRSNHPLPQAGEGNGASREVCENSRPRTCIPQRPVDFAGGLRDTKHDKNLVQK